MPTENFVTIEKIIPEGRSLGHIEGKSVLIWGGLPEEKVIVDVYKNKKSFSEARLIRVVEPSPIRIKERENHYLICSPWQVLPYNSQVAIKKSLLKQAFLDICDYNITDINFCESTTEYGYRTKLEFSFTVDKTGKIALAFHKRGVNNEYEIIKGCLLGSDKMNLAARKITAELNKDSNINYKGLKSLVIRESKTNNQIIAILYYKFKEFKFNIRLSDLGGIVDGLYIAYSSIKSPISVITELIYSEGINYLEEDILNLKIRYPFDGFFQNNIPLFEKTLTEIIASTPKCNRIVELYSGVGSIGLALCDKAKEVMGLEIVDSAVEYSEINKNVNKINNYKAIALADYKITLNILEEVDVLVLDPPRSGLHPKTTKLIIDTKPKKIIYLSCNPSTQARDYKILSQEYKIEKITGYDYYPNTFHMESLLVLVPIEK